MEETTDIYLNLQISLIFSSVTNPTGMHNIARLHHSVRTFPFSGQMKVIVVVGEEVQPAGLEAFSVRYTSTSRPFSSRARSDTGEPRAVDTAVFVPADCTRHDPDPAGHSDVGPSAIQYNSYDNVT